MPGIGVSELASRMSIHQSTCSQLLEKLAVRGMIVKTRSQTDQRCVGLSLSSSAEELLKRAPGPAEGVLPDALRAMPEDSLARLSASLSELMLHLDINDMRMAEKPLADL